MQSRTHHLGRCPYDAYGVQNIVLLYADSCFRVIFGPLRCVRVQIPVTFLFDFVREMICMRTEDKSGGSFCIQLAYKCSHTKLFVHRFPLPSRAIPTTIPAIPATIPNARNAIKCGHCTGTRSRWLVHSDQITNAQSGQW